MKTTKKENAIMRHIIVVVLAGMFLLVQPSLGAVDETEGPDDSIHWIVFTSTNGKPHEMRTLKCVDLIGAQMINDELSLSEDTLKAYVTSFAHHEGLSAVYLQIIGVGEQLKLCIQPMFETIEVPASDLGELS